MEHAFYEFISLFIGFWWGAGSDIAMFGVVLLAGLAALRLAIARDWDISDFFVEYADMDDEYSSYVDYYDMGYGYDEDE